jgi:ABC-2 type transport system permease protein
MSLSHSPPVRSDIGRFWWVFFETAHRYVQRQSAYMIELIRWPAFPVLYFVALYLTYSASGRDAVSGYPVAGFLLVGVVGIVLWSSNLWSSGYAIEFERREGTLESLFLSPASRSAVVLGYGAGSLFIMVIPTTVMLILLTIIFGVEGSISSIPAVLLSIAGMILASISLGYLLAGFFVLTRRANVIANFLQAPVHLLSGAVLPVSELPEPLQVFARLFPLSHGMDAIRESALAGATVADIQMSLVGLIGTSMALLAIGAVLLRRVERNARNGAELDFE